MKFTIFGLYLWTLFLDLGGKGALPHPPKKNYFNEGFLFDKQNFFILTKKAVDRLDLRMVGNEFIDKFQTRINIFGHFNA